MLPWLAALIAFAVVLGQLVLDERHPHELETELRYLVEPSHQLGLFDALASDEWQQISEVPNFGFREESFWFRLDVNVPPADAGRKLLELSYPILDSVELFVLRNGEVVNRFVTGDDLPFSERPIRHRNFVFPIDLREGSNSLVLRINTRGVTQAPLTLWEPLNFIEFYETQSIINGGYFGVMVIMVFYNLILYLGIRERPFVYYIGHVGTSTLFLATMHGLAYMHLWPEWVWWQSRAVPVLVSLSVVFIALFVTSFLDIAPSSRTGRGFRLLVGFAMIWTLASFVLPYPLALRVASFLSVTALTAALATSIWGWLKGKPAARFLVLAWSMFVLGSIALALNKVGILPRTAVTESGMLLGSMLDVVLLSIAMADRVRQERLLREAAQARAMEIEQKTRADLELAVADRTAQLEEAMAQLRKANKRLQNLSNVDGLTDVFNRRYFDSALEAAWDQAGSDGTPLALLLIDADRFKQINDTFGHPAGDEVLRRMAQTISGTLGERSNIVARIGGEEFVLILPETDLEQAQDIAERLRTDVEAMQVVFEGHLIDTTVSIGVAARSPEHGGYNDLMAAADRALYRAKTRGRNRVEC